MKLPGVNPKTWFTQRESRADIEDDNLIRIRDSITRTMTNFAMILMAGILILYGLNSFYIIVWVESDESWVSMVNLAITLLGQLIWNTDLPTISISRLVRLPGAIMFIVGGLLILLDSRRNFVRSVGLYALSMGLSRVVMVLPLLLSQEDISNGIGWLIALLGFNLIYSGYSMLSGSVRGKWGILIASGCYVVIYLLLIGFIILMFQGNSPEFIFDIVSPYILNFMMYFVLLWLLDTDEIRYGDKMSRHISILRNIDNTHRAAGLLTFTPQDAKKLASGKGWEEFHLQNGPVEKEMKLESETKTGITYVTVQKWYNDDHLYFTLSAYKDGTITLAERFRINRVVYNDDGNNLMYLLGDTGNIVLVDVKKKAVVE